MKSKGEKWIYHIVEAPTWQKVVYSGRYEPLSLPLEGFIHCSNQEQVAETAKRYYSGQTDLYLLKIEVEKVDAQVCYEKAANGELFPHIYGALKPDAVVDCKPFIQDQSGNFIFPYNE